MGTKLKKGYRKVVVAYSSSVRYEKGTRTCTQEILGAIKSPRARGRGILAERTPGHPYRAGDPPYRPKGNAGTVVVLADPTGYSSSILLLPHTHPPVTPSRVQTQGHPSTLEQVL